MIGLLGYNFCSDGNAIDPFPTSVTDITQTIIKQGIFDHFNVTSDITSTYSATPPTVWDLNTLMNCDFNGNVQAGNITTSNLAGIRIKRRIKGTFDWITIKFVEVTSTEDLSFTYVDHLNQNDTEYEYAYVPLYGGVGNYVEGTYFTSEVVSKFNGVFLCSTDTIYKFYAGVGYGTTERVQQVGKYEVLGRQYPIIISNGLLNYETGTVTGTVLQEDYEDTRVLDRQGIVNQAKVLNDFLTNKNPKILKDWNGNFWLVFITDNVQLNYNTLWGNGLIDATFYWSQIGDANNKKDLYNSGLIPTEE